MRYSTAERSLIEISELQSTLVTNLTEQNEHIEQLVQDSFSTTDNVGRGNKELKRASERTSSARILFHSTCAFCTFLIVWDLIF
jgi:syntaxin 18